MRVGGERVTTALLNTHRKMSMKGLIAALPIMIKQQREELAFHDYMATCIYYINKSVVKQYGGEYIATKFRDIVNPKPEDKRTSEEIINLIRGKLEMLGGGSN